MLSLPERRAAAVTPQAQNAAPPPAPLPTTDPQPPTQTPKPPTPHNPQPPDPQVNGGEVYLVVNAGCREKDLEHIGKHLAAAKVGEGERAPASCGPRRARRRSCPASPANAGDSQPKHPLFCTAACWKQNRELKAASPPQIPPGRGQGRVADGARRPRPAGAAGPLRRQGAAVDDPAGPLKVLLWQLCAVRRGGHPLLGDAHGVRPGAGGARQVEG